MTSLLSAIAALGGVLAIGAFFVGFVVILVLAARHHACNELMSLQTHLGPVSLDDRGLAVRLSSSVPRDPSIVPRTLHHVMGIIERIGARARETARGAYR